MWTVKSILEDTYGEIVDTLAAGVSGREAVKVVDDKIAQYEDSLWTLVAKGPRYARFLHRESGATLRLTVEVGDAPRASRNYPLT